MGNKLKKFFFNIDDYIAAVSLIFIVAITVASVFMRYVLDDPIEWVEEATLALFIWFTFVGASSVTKRDEHVSIDYFVRKLPKGLQRFLELIKFFVTAIVFLYVSVILGTQLALQASEKISPLLNISFTYIDLAAPLGGVLAIIHLIRLTIKKFRREGGA